jgi:DNA-binding transcriptional ArsR family regulator
MSICAYIECASEMFDMIMPRKNARHTMPPEALELIAARFRALGEPNRLRLIMVLEDGPQNVSRLVAATRLSQTNVSRHLQTLTDAGILARRKEGLNVLYSIADPSIFTLCEHVCGSERKRLAKHAEAFRLP